MGDSGNNRDGRGGAGADGPVDELDPGRQHHDHPLGNRLLQFGMVAIPMSRSPHSRLHVIPTRQGSINGNEKWIEPKPPLKQALRSPIFIPS